MLGPEDSTRLRGVTYQKTLLRLGFLRFSIPHWNLRSSAEDTDLFFEELMTLLMSHSAVLS
jgi:hypothetical protein